jgi:glycosyltransferase involved in cell wall biosynthesis
VTPIPPPTKTLHIVGNLDRGAVENWLVRMLRYASSKGIQLDWTFYCALGEPGCLDEEVRALGGHIIYSPVPIGQKWAFIKALRQELKHGCYEILHCHHDLISGIYLLAALGLPIRKRLVHVHNADESVLTPSPWKQRILRPLLRQLCLTFADGVIGISNHTLDTFLAGRPRREGRDRVHYYGIDPTPFIQAKADRVGFRRELGLADDAMILLFAGRVVPEKNPLFALEVFAAMRQRDPRIAAVFVGAGSLEPDLTKKAQALGVTDHFRALGWRTDIAEIMSCCDWFILPRPEYPMEGLGIAVVEAQLAGLRLLLSIGISDDALLTITKTSSQRLSLSDGPHIWAQCAMAQLKFDAPTRAGAAAALSQSPFELNYALQDLLLQQT